MKSGVYITCCLLLLCGCAQTNWRQASARPVSHDSEHMAASERVMVEKLIDETAREPKSRVPLLRAQNSDHPGISFTSSSAARTPLIAHDAATLTLIDRETRDLSPVERERAVATLMAIPSASVPAVLQLWKAGLTTQFGHSADLANVDSQTTSGGLVRGNPAPQPSNHAEVGLGQKSPWPDAQSRVNYPRDWSPQPATAARSSRSQQINRVNSAFGYSAPVLDGGARLGRLETGGGFDAAADNGPLIMSRNGARQNADRTGESITPGNMAIPSDWQTTQHSVARNAGPVAGDWDSSNSEEPRQLVPPREWHPTNRNPSRQPVSALEQPRLEQQFARPEHVRTMPERTDPRRSFADNRSVRQSPVLREKLPERPSEPLIRPQAKNSETNSPLIDRQEVQRVGYEDRGGSEQAEERSLVPGQALPGFEGAEERIGHPLHQQQAAVTHQHISQPLPTREVVPGNYKSDGDDSAWRMPPAAPRTTSPDEALRFLVRATESEVNQLSPGRSAAELQYYIERHVYLRLLYLMSGQSEWALRPIPNIPAADQEFWTQVIWGVENYFDLPRIPNHAERAAQTIAQFNTAMLRLKERAPLEMKNVTFCHTIEGYGEYETWPKDEFSPGQRVLVYAEIDNFHSELSAEGIYRTRLKSTLQIIANEAPEEPIDVKVYPVTEDYCRNHRRDYFHSYVVEIPVRCVRGSHELKLIVEDEQSGKVATHFLPFVVR